MRPVSKGTPYLYNDGDPYERAMLGLEARLGLYCSYCERHLKTGLEVEHLQPKGVPENAHLERAWRNFLLACKNCNTCKSDKNLPLADWLIPDRDNTFAAFEYRQDGVIDVCLGANKVLAEKTLDLLNLNKKVRQTKDENGKLLALDKRTQRMDSWILALIWRDKWNNRQNQDNEDAIIDIATKDGFFSIWMAAFDGVPQIRKSLIQAFPGTEFACFDPITTQAILPHPNSDGLADGSKL